MKKNSNIQRIEYTEFCKTIRKKIVDDMRIFNEKLVEIDKENTKIYKTRKALIIGKKQVIPLEQEHTKVMNKDEIIKLVTELCKDIYRAPVTRDEEKEEQDTLLTIEDSTEVSWKK